jgi:hypothetical protein
MKRNLLTCVWAGLLLCAAGIMTARASSTLITFSVDMSSNIASGSFNPPPGGSDQVFVGGTFNGWGPYVQLFQVGSSSIYTNTIDDTVDGNGANVNFIYSDTEGNEAPGDYENRMASLPATSGASLVLPTPYFNDLGPAASNSVKFVVDMSEMISIGQFNPQSGDTVVIAGSFNGWSPTAGAPWILTNDPSIRVTNNNFVPPVVESNVYTATIPVTLNARQPLASPNCAQEFKYVIMPEYNWESPVYPQADPDSGNRYFTEATQTLPLVNFNDAPWTPTANVTLNIDMSGVARYDTNFVANSVTAWGSFNGWATGIQMTNNPAGPNTNLYTSPVVSMGEGVPFVLQYRYTNSSYGGWVYDYAQDGGPNTANNNNYRRIIDLPVTTGILTTNFPAVYFNDLAPDDYLPTATPVLFSVDMTDAVGTDSHAFDPIGDSVYINGMFAGATPSQPNAAAGTSQYWYAWSGGASPPPAPPGFQMIEQDGTLIYTNTIVLPAGTPVALSYQYGIDPGSVNGGPVEDEAAVNSVHYRVVRSTRFSPYVMPTDTFGSQPYQEPFFSTGNIAASGNLGGGNLTVGKPAAGKVSVSWLGRPGAHLQSKGDLAGGAWQDLTVTDGTNWSSGSSSTNGFVSVTNVPASGNTFFRLVKP